MKADEILERLSKLVGREEKITRKIDETMIFKFPWAVDDRNPLWRDEAFARKTKWQGIIACPQFAEYLRITRHYHKDMNPKSPMDYTTMLPTPQEGGPTNVVGGEQVEYIQPIRVGDVLTTTYKITDVKKRFSKQLNREIVIRSYECRTVNQFGDLVQVHASTSLSV